MPGSEQLENDIRAFLAANKNKAPSDHVVLLGQADVRPPVSRSHIISETPEQALTDMAGGDLPRLPEDIATLFDETPLTTIRNINNFITHTLDATQVSQPDVLTHIGDRVGQIIAAKENPDAAQITDVLAAVATTAVYEPDMYDRKSETDRKIYPNQEAALYDLQNALRISKYVADAQVEPLMQVHGVTFARSFSNIAQNVLTALASPEEDVKGRIRAQLKSRRGYVSKKEQDQLHGEPSFNLEL